MLVTIESELKWEMNTLKKRGRLSVEAIARGTLSEGMRETESDKEKTGFLEGKINRGQRENEKDKFQKERNSFFGSKEKYFFLSLLVIDSLL